MTEISIISIIVMLLVLAIESTACAKERSRFVTAQMRANALENAKNTPGLEGSRKRRFHGPNAGSGQAMTNSGKW